MNGNNILVKNEKKILNKFFLKKQGQVYKKGSKSDSFLYKKKN